MGQQKKTRVSSGLWCKKHVKKEVTCSQKAANESPELSKHCDLILPFFPFVAQISLPVVWHKVWSNINKQSNSVWGALKEVLNWLFIVQRATTEAWGTGMIMKTALVADGIDCVCNEPSMDQLQPCYPQKVRRCAKPTSIYHHLLSYSYMTHLHICEAITLAWTCLHHPGTKALNTMPESCFNNSNNVVYPPVQTVCSSTVAF